MKYKKLPIKGYKQLNMYPVYVESIYNGHEPFKIVGIRENQIEIEGDFSGGTHNVSQRSILTVCTQNLPQITDNYMWIRMGL
jgi:hypothetical protein